MPASWPWCGAAGAVAGLFDEASFELPTPMPRDAEMPHGDFLSLEILVPAKGWVHCRSIDTCSRCPNCQSVDSGFSSPHVRFEPTCIIRPCRGVERQWWLGGRGSPRAAKRCPRCPVRAALSERPPSPRTTPRFDDALDVCMLHCLPSLLLSLCRHRREGQKGNGAFACSFPPRNGS